jgi:hypothetical protein
MPQNGALQPNETLVSADDCGKGCCIIDTGALIDLCKVELSGRLAIEWVLQDFCFLIPKKIFDEGCPYASFESYANLYFSTIKGFVRACSETCEMIIDEQIESLPKDFKKGLIDAGERIGAAFAFEMSRQEVQYVIFVTNDFKASPPLRYMLNLMQIGMLKDAYDILVFLASRHPNEIPLRRLDEALRHLNSVVRDSSIPASEGQVPDEILLRHLQIINKFPDAFADY